MIRRFSCAAFLAVFALSDSPLDAQGTDRLPSPQPSFLEIAGDPDASPAQKKTIAAMMAFVGEADPIAAFGKLEAADSLILYGEGKGGLSDLSPLHGLTALETLVLYNHDISDITPVASLVNLKTLRLEVNRIHDIGPLANLTRLESLQIDDNRISDLRPLAGLSRLRTLWISRNRVSEILPLAGLTQLRDLHLSGNQVTDLTVFSGLALCTLNLDGNGIVDISDLRAMNQSTTCFISLDLSDNAIRDVSPLAGLARVSSLDLANNRIEDPGALRNPELRWLDLEGNRLSKVPDLRHLKLSSINLRRNPIEDHTDLVALKKANPRMEILADEGFTRAFEESFPMRKELEGSPLLGTWRTEALETEWGSLVMELRFLASGVVYVGMLPAEPAEAGARPEGFSTDGIFAVRNDRIEMTVGGDTTNRRFTIGDDVLTLVEDGEQVRYKRVGK